MDIIESIKNKNSIITSNPGGGSTSLGLYIVNNLILDNNIIYFNTTFNLDNNYIYKNYNNLYNNCIIMQSSIEHFFNYINDISGILDDIDYIIIDTADIMGKDSLKNLVDLLNLFNVNLICTSQLRVNPNNSQPYSTVEQWNKQLIIPIFNCSIWIRKVNEPGNFNRKYIDIYNNYRIGNHYSKRFILNFNEKDGTISGDINERN